MTYKFKVAACGGTFDRLHKGHEAFLKFAFSKAKLLIIGLTSDKFVKKYKKKKNISTFYKRKKDLKNFLEKEEFFKKAKIIPIDDTVGPTVNNSEQIEAIIVTEDTLSRTELINRKRVEFGLQPLSVISMPVIKTGDVKISSSLIRDKIMNINGDLILPDSLRASLKKPFGKIITDTTSILNLDPQKIVAIGDVTTKTCNELNIKQKFSVIDFTVKREKTYNNLQELKFTGTEKVFYAKNPSGHITRSLWNTIEVALRDKEKNIRNVILVEGEEDLSVVPFVLMLPVGWNILYGQPDKGMVRVQINSKIKKEYVRIITLFDKF